MQIKANDLKTLTEKKNKIYKRYKIKYAKQKYNIKLFSQKEGFVMGCLLSVIYMQQ